MRWSDCNCGQGRRATEQIILGEILEPLGTHLSLQGGPGGEFIYSDPGYTALIDSAVAVGRPRRGGAAELAAWRTICRPSPPR